jgi:hypothetical protein
MKCITTDSNRKNEMLILPTCFTQCRKKNRCSLLLLLENKGQKAVCITALLNLNPDLLAGRSKIFGLGQ